MADFTGIWTAEGWFHVAVKVTNGYRAMWATPGEADGRTVVDTARLAPNTIVLGTILTTVTA